MNCEQFESRLNLTLDAGLAPQADTELQQHAQLCAGCRELRDTYALMLGALTTLPAPQPAPGFADRVLECFSLESANGQTELHSFAKLPSAATRSTAASPDAAADWTQRAARWSPWLLALAAGLLIAVWGLRGSLSDREGSSQLANAPVEPAAGPTGPVDRSPPPASLREVALLVPGLSAAEPTANEDLDSGQAVSEANQVALARDWTGDLSNGLKPLARSASGTLDLMLGALTTNESRRGLPDNY